MKFFKNTVLAAACIALALVPVAASSQSNVRVHVRSYAQKDAEDSTDSFDSTDSYESADSTDSYDSADSTDSTDNYESEDSMERYEQYLKGFTKIDCPGGSPMSVQGAVGVFCVYGDACSGNTYGNCPDAQPGLEQGAYCGVVTGGALGCKLSADGAHRRHRHHHKSQQIDCPGGSPMSVEGVEGVFCVTGQACVADIANGACPGPQTGLPNGASCGVVKTGVYGCKPNSGSAPAPAETPCPSTAAPTSPPAETPCPSTAAPTSAPAETPCPSTAAPTSAPVVTPCSPSGAPAPASTTCNGPNQSPMSVEGVEGVFCVTGQACVADISNGACPGPQSGLEHGASCGIVKTGVYGCKPNNSRKHRHHHRRHHH